MLKRTLTLFLALSMLFCLTACGGEKTKAPLPESAARVFTDDCGREVEIPGLLTRVVPSGPLSQIVLYAIAPDMFVGLGGRWGESAKPFIPKETLDLPFFGQLYGSADLNVEELAAVGPQLVIDVGEAKKSTAEDMDALEAQTGIPSVHIEASLASMPGAFRKLGEVLGREEKAEELAGFCEKVYERTLGIMEQVGDNRVNALYVLGEEGLNVLAKGSYHAELLDLLTNDLAEVDNPVGKGTGNEVTMEQLALWDPEFLIFAPGSIYGTVSEKAAWKELSAIKNGNYVEVPQGPHNWMGSPPSVQRYLGLIWLTAVLYPDYCDYDVQEEITEYYRLFYGCELTNEQYETLTANAFLR